MAFPTRYGSVAGRKLQFVKETTKGTQVKPSTALWRGPVEGFEYHNDPTFPQEHVGYVSGLNRSYVPLKYATLKVPETELTFEQGPYLFAMGVKNLQTAVADGGGGAGKIYAYPLSTTLPYLDFTSYSVQSGDDIRARFAAYAFCDEITVSGKAGEAWKISGNLVTRPPASNTLTASTISFDNSNSILDSANGLAIFPVGAVIKTTSTNNPGPFTVTSSAAGELGVTEATATEAAGSPFTLEETYSAITPTTVEEVLFTKSTFAIDAVGGTLGATAKQGTLLSAKLSIKTGRTPNPTADGDAATPPVPTFSVVTLDANKLEAVLELVFESETTLLAEEAAYLAGTARQIRIKSTGAAITAGTAYSYKTFMIDIAGTYEKMSSMADGDGNNVYTLTLRGRYDATASLFCSVTFVNLLAALV